MNTSSASTTHPNTLPFPAPHAASSGPAAAPADGAKSDYSPKVIDLICVPIRRYGFTDDDAAESVGMRPQTLWRWKHDHPEIGQKLQQARQECRIHYLELMAKTAEGDGPHAFRAALWFAERIFPGEYAKTIGERWKHQTFERQRAEREERAVGDEIWAEKQAAQRTEQARARQAAEAEAAKPSAAPESDVQNVQNAADAAAPTGREASPPRAGDLANTERGHAKSVDEGTRLEHAATSAESDLPSVINAGRPDAGPLLEAIFGPRLTDLHSVKNPRQSPAE